MSNNKVRIAQNAADFLSYFRCSQHILYVFEILLTQSNKPCRGNVFLLKEYSIRILRTCNKEKYENGRASVNGKNTSKCIFIYFDILISGHFIQ